MKHQLNPADLVDSLDPDAIAQRLTELTREEAALRVLLRSARARQHARRRQADAEKIQKGGDR